MKETLDLWCEEVTKATPGLPTGGGVKWQYYYEPLYQHHITSTDPAVNPWWGIVEQTLTGDCGVKINPSVFPAATDSRAKALAIELAQLRERVNEPGSSGASPSSPAAKGGKRNTFAPSTAGDQQQLLGGKVSAAKARKAAAAASPASPAAELM